MAATDSARRRSPLEDLVESEETYVAALMIVIKRAASAWSRKQMPPGQLDMLFRAIEAVYRVSKALLSKLTEIGPTPCVHLCRAALRSHRSSAKALGDLLMRFVDDLEPAYNRYAAHYRIDFDHWEAVQSNEKLATILAASPGLPDEPGGAVTLDRLFALPYERLRYYKRLYAKLLRSTQPGRSDHRLLVGANDRLDVLLESTAAAAVRKAGADEETEAEAESTHTPIAGPSRSSSHLVDVGAIDLPPLPLSPNPSSGPGSGTPSMRASTASSFTGNSTATTSIIAPPRSHSVSPQPPDRATFASISSVSEPAAAPRERTTTLSLPAQTDGAIGASVDALRLEQTLDTARTLDIFTMKPKMHPPTLTFFREVRRAGNVHLSLSPTSDPERRELSIRNAFVYLLTDLFLVCERIAPGEMAQDGADMWLLFPPLAGKHLRVTPLENDPTALEVLVMKKERLVLRTPSPRDRDAWMAAFEDAIGFGASQGLRVQTGSMSSRSGTPSPIRASPNSQTPAPESAMSASAFSHHSLPAAAGPLPMSASRGPQHRSYTEDRGSRPPRGPDQDFVPPPPRKQSMYGMPGQSPMSGPPQPSRGPPSSSLSNGGLSSSQQAQYRDFRNGSSGPPEAAAPGLRKTPSSRSAGSVSPAGTQARPPLPPGAHLSPHEHAPMQRSRSDDGMRRHYRAPSAVLAADSRPRADLYDPDDFSPPGSPVERADTRPSKTSVVAQMRCKVFLQQSRVNWRPLGTAKLKLYRSDPDNVKQLVVEGDKGILISTIILTDGVERIGKTGVAVELSDKGSRTGAVYLLHMKSEQSAQGLYEQLLLGSDRSRRN